MLVIEKDEKFLVEIFDFLDGLSGIWLLKSEDEEKKEVKFEMVLKFGDFEELMIFIFMMFGDGYVKV